ncbi:MAG: S9 family peptidase [Acidimicrobiales bacterium]
MKERMPEPRVTAAMCAYGRVLSEPKLAPDGRRVAFVVTAFGVGAIVTVPTEGGPELVVTSDPPPSAAPSYGGGAFDWTPDGRGLVYSGADGAVWLAPATGGRPRLVADEHTNGPAGAPAVSPDGTRVAYVIDQHHVAVAPLDPDDGWPVRLSTGADFCFDPVWSADGTRVAWHEWDVPAMPWDASRIVLRDSLAAEKRVVVAGGGDVVNGTGVATGQPRFAPDGSVLAFLCDQEGWLNLWVSTRDGHDPGPLLPEDTDHGFPSWGLGQRSYAWSPDGSRIAFTRNERGFIHLCVVDVDAGEVAHVAHGYHGALSWAGDRLVALHADPTTPSRVVVYDVDRWATNRTLACGPVGGWGDIDVQGPEAVTWPGDDGATVHGRLYRPVHSATAQHPPPLLVWIHGGPTSQWPAAFNARFAFFLERGWAILVPDHRGSTGFGRAYTQAMAGRWGDLDVADTAAGMLAAAARGWGDPHRMVPIGGSAGGFTVLNLLARRPELCAGGIDLFGVADLFDLDETTHRFEKHYLHTVVGPLPQAADRYRERSPINVADKIEAPLLILQGGADKVVPPAQSQVIADRLKERGRPVELHIYEGEGHGWNRPDTVVDELNRIEDFLRRHVLRWRA